MCYLYEGDVIKDGQEFSFSNHYPSLQHHLENIVGCSVQDVFKYSSVVIHGLEYRTDCALVNGYDEIDYPQFVILNDVVVHDHNKYFIVEETQNVRFQNHTLSYTIKKTGQLNVLSYHKLKFKWPLSVYTVGQQLSIQNAYSHTCQML